LVRPRGRVRVPGQALRLRSSTAEQPSRTRQMSVRPGPEAPRQGGRAGKAPGCYPGGVVRPSQVRVLPLPPSRCSSTGQSRGLLRPRLQVRVLPAVQDLALTRAAVAQSERQPPSKRSWCTFESCRRRQTFVAHWQRHQVEGLGGEGSSPSGRTLRTHSNGRTTQLCRESAGRPRSRFAGIEESPASTGQGAG
jgi:hypothetical protein